MTTLTTLVDADGIALATIDVPGASLNVITPALQEALGALVERLKTDPALTGAVLTSGKDSGFIAGADLKAMEAALVGGEAPLTPGLVQKRVAGLSRLFRALETCGKPVAVAINGLAMGGGLELALACHYRVVADDPAVKLGLPEVLVGLLPGAGGTQRLPRLMGVQAALMYLLQGKSFSPQEALGFGVVHALAPKGETVATATAWVRANIGKPIVAPWDQKGFKVPGGAGMFNPGFVTTMIGANAMVQKEALHNYHAPQAILSCVYEGLHLPFDRALTLETKYFTKLILDPQARAMIRTLFVNKQAAEKGARRPAGQAKAPTQRLAMLGAGLMGAGIAMVSAQAGIEVVLLDRDLAAAEKGKSYAAERLHKDVGRGKLSPEKAAAVLARIQPTATIADVAGCDLVIEAVFEDRAIKAEITQKVAAVLGAEGIFGSNTSTLPIGGLAQAWPKPEGFIGIHFFSPVEKMPLVEIIVGPQTGPEAIAKALDYVAQIRKTPIVVNDSRGFYTSRCFGTYVLEGYAMVAEGVSPALIDNMGKFAGMPVGPLAVGDEVAIDLSYKIKNQSIADMGDSYQITPGDAVIDTMVALGRYGRKNGQGFYVYPADGGGKYLWPDIARHFPTAAVQPDPAEVRERLIFRQMVECARCFAEGVLETPEDGDLGAIFGWGFAPFTGGPFSSMDQLGLATVVATLDRLAARHGPRFTPPPLLREMAAAGRTFYGRIPG